MKRVDMAEVRSELKRLIEEHYGNFCVDTVLPKDNGVWNFIIDDLSEYIESATGKTIYFRESDDTFMKINNYVEEHFKPLRTFSFTPNQEQAWEDSMDNIRWKLLNDLVELAENSEDDFYGEQYCTKPLKEILLKYCDSWW